MGVLAWQCSEGGGSSPTSRHPQAPSPKGWGWISHPSKESLPSLPRTAFCSILTEVPTSETRVYERGKTAKHDPIPVEVLVPLRFSIPGWSGDSHVNLEEVAPGQEA